MSESAKPFDPDPDWMDRIDFGHLDFAPPEPVRRQEADKAPEYAGDHTLGPIPGTPSLSDTGKVFWDTDIANGRRLVADCGRDLRYVADWSRWVVYDGVRWAIDKSGTLVQELAKDTTARLAAEAAEAVSAAARVMAAAVTTDDKDRAKQQRAEADRALAHAKRSQDIRAVRRMIESAKSERGVNVQHGWDVFDTRPELLNCPNGTVDLRTGELHPHRREDFITRLCPVRFEPGARRTNYVGFVAKVFRDNPTVAEYVRRLSGYVLTGETCDHSFHVFHGDGSNGKSLLLNLWTAVLGSGEYQHTAAAELLVNDGRDRHPTEKVGLRGARLVVCQESQEGGHLDEAKVKSLTSEDLIDARGMGQDFYQFKPTHKLILSTNHKPRLKGNDDGIRRRIRLVPFTMRFWKEADRGLNPHVTFDPDLRADPQLYDRLKADELEGILADMVKNAVAFYANGKTIAPPTVIVAATSEYFTAEDLIGQFFEAQVKADEDGAVKAAEFYQHFKRWAVSEGHDERRLPSIRKFGIEAEKRFEKVKKIAMIYRVRVFEAYN